MSTIQTFRAIYWRTRQCLAAPNECLKSTLRPWRSRIARRNKYRIFALNVNNKKLGFFANLNLCLHFLYFCERNNIIPHINITSPNYLDRRHGPCWFHYFFENLALDPQGLQRVRRGEVTICEVRNARDMGFTTEFNADYYSRIDIRLAHELVVKYIRIKQEIADKVEHFVKQNFHGKRVLAIHFRGTDKLIEAPRVSWDYCKMTVRNYLKTNPDVTCIFVASDESDFIDFVDREFPCIIVCHHDDHHRSTGNQAIHLDYGSGENYYKGEDALINCLLMARCTALIKSSSLLSAWSSVFNPSLPIILLNRPHHDADIWFPESELAHRSMDEYLPSLIST